MSEHLPNKNRCKLDIERLEMQEGIRPIPKDYPGAKYLYRDREVLANMSPELRKERMEVSTKLKLIGKVYDELGDGLDNWNEREANLQLIKKL